MIALLGAMKEEINGLLKLISVDETIAQHGWHLHKGMVAGKGILLAQTGLGRARSQDAARFVLDHFPVASVISFGFGGALVGELGVGDLVLCTRIYCASMPETVASYDSDGYLLAQAAAALEGSGISFRRGIGLTVDRLVNQPEEKRALGMAFDAHIVEMESYWVGLIAAGKQLPFLAVRAVSDELGQTLPPFDRLLGPGGEWLWNRASIHLTSHPRDLLGLARIALNARRAGKNLTRFLDTFLLRL